MSPADVVVHPVEKLADRFASLVEETASASIAERGAFALAIPGGSAARLLLPRLVTSSIDTNRIDVFWVDERMVPPDDPGSNFREAGAAWLNHVAIGSARVHRMQGEASSASAVAAAYDKALPERVDLVLLGVGPDGHVASLFPRHRLLRAWDRKVAVLEDAPKPPPRRMTLTLKALTSARRMIVFAAGPEKADAVADALGNEDSELPLALAMMGGAPVTFLLDPAAASGL